MGVKRSIQREKLRAEGRLKRPGKKKCKWCGQWGCVCKPRIDTSILDNPVLENTSLALLPALTAIALRRARRKPEE